MEFRKKKHSWESSCRIPDEKYGLCFCKASNKLLYESYPKSQNYCYSKTVNHILSGTKSKEFIDFVDQEHMLEDSDLLKR